MWQRTTAAPSGATLRAAAGLDSAIEPVPRDLSYFQPVQATDLRIACAIAENGAVADKCDGCVAVPGVRVALESRPFGGECFLPAGRIRQPADRPTAVCRQDVGNDKLRTRLVVPLILPARKGKCPGGECGPPPVEENAVRV
jgi:hypothetical protein